MTGNGIPRFIVWPDDQPGRAIRAWEVCAAVAAICGVANLFYGEWLTAIALATATIASLGAVMAARRWARWKSIALELARVRHEID